MIDKPNERGCRQYSAVKLTAAQEDRLVRAYLAGCWTENLVERFNISAAAISRILRKRGVTRDKSIMLGIDPP